MEDLWKKTEDLDCDVCAGVNDRCCGEMVAHYPEYVERIIERLGNFLMPDDESLKLIGFITERSLWMEVGHWTCCYLCGMLRIALKDYDIYHERAEGSSTLRIWHYPEQDYAKGELVFSASWTIPSFKPAQGSIASGYTFES